MITIEQIIANLDQYIFNDELEVTELGTRIMKDLVVNGDIESFDILSENYPELDNIFVYASDMEWQDVDAGYYLRMLARKSFNNLKEQLKKIYP